MWHAWMPTLPITAWHRAMIAAATLIALLVAGVTAAVRADDTYCNDPYCGHSTSDPSGHRPDDTTSDPTGEPHEPSSDSNSSDRYDRPDWEEKDTRDTNVSKDR